MKKAINRLNERMSSESNYVQAFIDLGYNREEALDYYQMYSTISDIDEFMEMNQEDQEMALEELRQNLNIRTTSRMKELALSESYYEDPIYEIEMESGIKVTAKIGYAEPEHGRPGHYYIYDNFAINGEEYDVYEDPNKDDLLAWTYGYDSFKAFEADIIAQFERQEEANRRDSFDY
jgi:hypothetical protein